MSLLLFGIGPLFKVFLLVVNGIAILNEERFLAKIGWSTATQNRAEPYDASGFGPSGELDVKARLINLITAVRTLLRIPLIGINIFAILLEIVFG